MFAADAPIFLADTGEEVTWTDSVTSAVLSSSDVLAGAVPRERGLMLFDQPDTDMESGVIISREYEVTFETAAWPNLRRGEILVVAGAGRGLGYMLRTDPHQLRDGVFSVARLSKP